MSDPAAGADPFAGKKITATLTTAPGAVNGI
jgi:hypothetical protein